MKLPRKPNQIITFDMKKMQLYMLLLTFGALFAGFFFAVIFHSEGSMTITLLKFLAFIGLYIIGIILHEFFHLLGFIIWGKCRWSDLVYGINRELGVAYAGTKKTLRNHAMKKALLLPFWLTGLLPYLIGIYLNNGTLISVSALLIGGAVGDFAMYNQLRKINKDAYIIDDIEKPQLYVYLSDPHATNT